MLRTTRRGSMVFVGNTMEPLKVVLSIRPNSSSLLLRHRGGPSSSVSERLHCSGRAHGGVLGGGDPAQPAGGGGDGETQAAAAAPELRPGEPGRVRPGLRCARRRAHHRGQRHGLLQHGPAGLRAGGLRCGLAVR